MSESQKQNNHEEHKTDAFTSAMVGRDRSIGNVDNISLFLSKNKDISDIFISEEGREFLNTPYNFYTTNELFLFLGESLDLNDMTRLEEYDIKTFPSDTLCKTMNRMESYVRQYTDDSQSARLLESMVHDDYDEASIPVLHRLYSYMLLGTLNSYERTEMLNIEKNLSFCKGRHPLLRQVCGGSYNMSKEVRTKSEKESDRHFQEFRREFANTERAFDDLRKDYEKRIKEDVTVIKKITISSLSKTPEQQSGDSKEEIRELISKYSNIRTGVSSTTPKLVFTSNGVKLRESKKGDIIITNVKEGSDGLDLLKLSSKNISKVQINDLKMFHIRDEELLFGIPRKGDLTFKGLEHLLRDKFKEEPKKHKPVLAKTLSFSKIRFEEEGQNNSSITITEVKPKANKSVVVIEEETKKEKIGNDLVLNFDQSGLLSLDNLNGMKINRQASSISFMNMSGYSRMSSAEMASLGYYLHSNEQDKYKQLLETCIEGMKPKNPVKNLEEIFNKWNSFIATFNKETDNVKFFIVTFLSNNRVAKEFVVLGIPIISMRNNSLIENLDVKTQRRIQSTSKKLFESAGMTSEYMYIPKRGKSFTRGSGSGRDRGGRR